MRVRTLTLKLNPHRQKAKIALRNLKNSKTDGHSAVAD
jgi:hypothetical protein